jgi:cell division protein FtsI/penicillin-binding protein 2
MARIVLLLAAFALIPCCGMARAQSLYAQSIQTALVPVDKDLEVYLLDLRTHEVLADTFAQPATPIPVGSLLKPFLALAYGLTHSGDFPTTICHGHPDRCWKVEGHGPMTLVPALAQSCNAYFLALARGLGPQGIAAIRYLPAPPHDASPETLIGLTPDWPIAPSMLVAAYAQLLAAPSDATETAILAGMRGSANSGTAARVGSHPGGVLAKSGTAPCTDPQCRASGDGLVVAAVPAAHPTLLLLVRKRATTGAMTAAAAGRILSRLEALHAE